MPNPITRAFAATPAPVCEQALEILKSFESPTWTPEVTDEDHLSPETLMFVPCKPRAPIPGNYLRVLPQDPGARLLEIEALDLDIRPTLIEHPGLVVIRSSWLTEDGRYRGKALMRFTNALRVASGVPKRHKPDGGIRPRHRRTLSPYLFH